MRGIRPEAIFSRFLFFAWVVHRAHDDYSKKWRAEKTGELMFNLLLRRIAGLKPLKIPA